MEPTYSSHRNAWLFLMNWTETFQVFSMTQARQWPDMITDYPDRVTGIAAAPVGPGLIVSTDQGGSEYHQIRWINLDTREDLALTTNPAAMHLFGAFSPDGETISYTATGRNRRDFDLYIASVRGQREAQLVRELSGHWEVLDWRGNDTLILQERRTYAVDERLYRLSLGDGVLVRLTPDEKAVWDSPVWSADGSLFVRTDLEREFLSIVRLTDDRVDDVVSEAADVEHLVGDPAGHWLAYSVNRQGYSELHLYTLEDGQDRRVAAFDNQVILGLSPSGDGQSLAVAHSGPRQNANISVVSVKTREVRQWTVAPTPGLDPSQGVVPELVHCPSFDGLPIPAFVYRPAGREAAPVVVSVHGGPEAQERPGFNPLYQYLVERGYAVIAPNVRGSSGYGKRYVHLDDREKRMDSVKDLKAVVDYIRETPEFDGQRIALWGGSYGGFMVLSGITQYPEYFRAAIDIVGISNLETFLENTSEYRRALRESEYGYLATDREFLRQFSPIHYVDRIRAALFVVHGANDPRVPLEEAQQMVAALQARGLPVVFRVFSDEGHGLAKKSNRLAAYPEMVAFLDQHLGG